MEMARYRSASRKREKRNWWIAHLTTKQRKSLPGLYWPRCCVQGRVEAEAGERGVSPRRRGTFKETQTRIAMEGKIAIRCGRNHRRLFLPKRKDVGFRREGR